MGIITARVCTSCKLEKDSSEFYDDPRLIGGKGAMCKPCRKDVYKKSRTKNAQTRMKSRREYYEKNKARELGMNKEYIVKNKERLNSLHKNYRIENREHLNSVSKAKFQTLEGRAIHWKAQAKRRGIDWDIDINYLKTLPMVCFYTNQGLTLNSGLSNTISLDRVDNSKGYIVGNVVFCTKLVNKIKFDMDPNEFLGICKMVAENNGLDSRIKEKLI